MAKYGVIELKIENGKLTDLEEKREPEKNKLKHGDVVYIYRSTRRKKFYIGQTIHFLRRHDEHHSGREERFAAADFDQVIVVYSRYFNLSALSDVESQLITYFVADHTGTSRYAVEFDKAEVINRTGGNSVNDYEHREKVASEVILPLWEQTLYGKGWVRTRTLVELRTKALVKYSPIKMLTEEQGELISEIINSPDTNYVINGDAGTGKTVLLTHLTAAVLKNRPDAKIGVVVQPNWEKTGTDIFKVFGLDSGRLSVMTSTKLIKSGGTYDVIIVDEAHKMSRNYGKQHPSFSEVYKIEEYAGCESHLEILQKIGGQMILMYDVLQGIRPAHVTREMFRSLTEGYEKKFLRTQFRIQTPEGKTYTSDDYLNGIKYLLYKDTGLLESDYTRFDPDFSREIFRDRSPDAYFGYVTDQPLHKLTEWLEEDRNFNPEHINRILAGLVEEWRQSDGRDPDIRHWHEGDISLRWNSTQENWINSKDEDAEEQVGSVFAVQGIDLNKVGVLIGNDLQPDDEGRLRAVPENFYNTNGTFTAEEMKTEENKFEFTLFVMNIYYVLLTRGIDGIRVGFWKNDVFRRYMEETLEIR